MEAQESVVTWHFTRASFLPREPLLEDVHAVGLEVEAGEGQRSHHVVPQLVGTLEEPPMPSGTRWWSQQVESWASEKRARGEIGEWGEKRLVRNVRRMPPIFAKMGFKPPTHASAVTRTMVLTFREGPIGLGGGALLPGTTQQMLLSLRQFLRAEGVPLSEESAIWKTPKPVTMHRRWVTKEMLTRLLNEARGRERIPLYLCGTNGLRSIEVSRLTVGNVNLDLSAPTLTVHGKGRNGGKWRTIPLSELAYPVLLDACQGKRLSDPVYPISHRMIQKDVAAVGARLGIKLSSHDLRRSFGRIAYYAGVPIVTLKNLYGHESVDMTSHYVGVDVGEMTTGLQMLSHVLAPESTKGG